MAEISAGGFGQPANRSVGSWRARRWLLLSVLAAVLALLALLLYGLRNNPSIETGGVVPLNRPAPDFAVETVGGQQVRLSELRGKVVVLNIWASWCLPCQEESVAINQSFARFGGPDVVFVGLAYNDDDEQVRKFVRKYQVPYGVALDPEGRIFIDYGATGVPETFLIDREGRLTQKWIGPITAPRLNALIEPLVR